MTRRELLIYTGAQLVTQELSAAEPQNAVFPLQGINGSITPQELFFVRDHFSEPELSLHTWRLNIEGRVAHPLELSFADLLESPGRNLEAVLECAGNPAGGSAVSNGVWEGVPLANILERAGAETGSIAVLLEGADTGRVMEDTPDLPYSRLVPFSKCVGRESLIAFKLNNRFLARKNGFPARALFAGWYGMDSVKWLRRIVVLGPSDNAPGFEASGISRIYNRILKNPTGETKVARLTELQVKSAIAWPAGRARLPAGTHMIRGFAWTGAGTVQRVEISTDGGQTWAHTHLASPPRPFSWVRWEYAWSAAPGDHVLVSRATDDAGRQQPMARDASRQDGYELNHCATTTCSVR
jgi:DMSO/TMAO reductase YedYZ molybdopterin-dependent catalytic subunit